MKKLKFSILTKSLMGFGLAFLALSPTNAQTLPTAKAIAAQMGAGWNLGNTMEAIIKDSLGNYVPDHTSWGNDIPTAAFMDYLKASGIKTFRITAAWDGYADPNTGVISPAWFTKVKTVVDLAYSRDMYVILNIHWDGGWLEENITTAKQSEVNTKQQNYWTQIANYFNTYGERLLFASANEPGQSYSDSQFDQTFISVLNSYHQTFINAVRATGGNNASRTLIIQGPKTDIEKTNSLFTTLPTDQIADRLMVEVHFYPYSFTLMETTQIWGGQPAYPAFYWGAGNHSSTDTDHNPTWGEESFVDSVFNLMKTQFVDKNIPVVIGEFGAIQRNNLSGDNLILHLRSRKAFYQHVISQSIAKGMIPVIWDTGAEDANNMTLLSRETGKVFDVALFNGVRKAIGLDTIPGELTLSDLSNSMKILYSAKDSLFGQVNLGVPQPNFSAYDSIIVRAYVNGNSTYDDKGTPAYGFVNLNLVTMSTDNWVWREAPFGDLSFDSWENYSIPLAKDTNVTGALVPADPTKVNFFALQAYSKAYNGTIYIDYIAFIDNEGQNDTLFTFDITAPSEYSGNVKSVSLIPNQNVMSDTEWKTATQYYGQTTNVILNPSNFEKFNGVQIKDDLIQASFISNASGASKWILSNMLGQVIAEKSFNSTQGLNEIEFKMLNSGMAVLQVITPTQSFSALLRNH